MSSPAHAHENTRTLARTFSHTSLTVGRVSERVSGKRERDKKEWGHKRRGAREARGNATAEETMRRRREEGEVRGGGGGVYGAAHTVLRYIIHAWLRSGGSTSVSACALPLL